MRLRMGRVGVAAMLLVVAASGGQSALAADGLSPLTPQRIVDTRNTGRLSAGEVLAVAVWGQGGVPTGASAVVANVTAVNPDEAGYLTVYPCDAELPVASNVNYSPGQVAPNAVVAKLSSTGAMCVYSLAATDVLIDVAGHVPAGSGVMPVTPKRLVDTRNTARLAAGAVLRVPVSSAVVPAGSTAVIANVTAVNPDGAGFLTVYPCDAQRPVASNVNYSAGQVAPNAVLSKLSASSEVCIYSLAATDVLVDLAGYVGAAGGVTPATPERITDTRTTARLGAGATLPIQVTGRAGVPGGATAAWANVTAVNPGAAGFLTVYPCDAARPNASNVNYQPGQVAPNAVLAKLSTSGQLCVYTLAATDVLVDVAGFIPGDAGGGPGGPPPAGGGEVEVVSCNAGSELVVIRNPGAVTANLAGWVLHDEGNLHSVDLGTLASSLGAGQQLGIKSGDGALGAGQVRWKTQNVWNNDGDTAYLISPSGTTISKPCT